jgi:hypothetical protein
MDNIYSPTLKNYPTILDTDYGERNLVSSLMFSVLLEYDAFCRTSEISFVSLMKLSSS